MKVLYVSKMPPAEGGFEARAEQFKSLKRLMGVDVECFPWNNNPDELIEVLKGYDILHIEYSFGDYWFELIKILKAFSGRIILRLHEDYSNKNILIRVAVSCYERKLLDVADAILVHTSEHKDKIFEYYRSKVHIIPHGVIVYDEERTPDNETILLPGFIQFWKGHTCAIKAMDIVRKHLPAAQLLMVGKAKDARFLDKLNDHIHNYNLSKNITITNKYVSEDEWKHYFKKATVVVVPYRRIVQSGILCNCVTWQVPTIASDLVGLREYGRNAIDYFPVKNYRIMAEKIIAVLKHKEIRDTMIDELGKLREEYSWDNVNKKIIDIYKK